MAAAEDPRPAGEQPAPPRGRFQKGQSGNPKGRPRKTASLGGDIDKALSETVEIRENGRKRKITKRRAAAKQVANASASGDLRAIKLAADMTAPVDSGALHADAPLSPAETEIAERLVARIRQGWRPEDEPAA